MKQFRFVLAICFALALLLSLAFGILIRFGLVMPFIAVSIAGMWLCLRWENFVQRWIKLRKNFWGKLATNTIVALIAIAIITFAVISGLMINAMNIEPPEDEDTVVIVLGARVVGYRPSRILQLRIEEAYAHLSENPTSVAVLAGGLGDVAYISEAEAMKRWLVANGIAPYRLFLEDRSTSTYENIRFSEIIISENNLSQNVVIASDGFHMFRAQHVARQLGLNPSAAPSRTPLEVLPLYWVREVVAIIVNLS